MNIQQIAKSIDKLINSVRPPKITFPAILLLCSIIKRPGMSAMMATADAIAGQTEYGAPPGDLPDGTPNMMNRDKYNIIKSMYKDITRNGIVQITIPTGGIQVTVMGTNGGGPVISTGVNTNNVTGYGFLS